MDTIASCFQASYNSEGAIIAGNAALYGATAGKAPEKLKIRGVNQVLILFYQRFIYLLYISIYIYKEMNEDALKER